jgi:hypothetical protein
VSRERTTAWSCSSRRSLPQQTPLPVSRERTMAWSRRCHRASADAAGVGVRVSRAHDCTVVVLAPPLGPAGSIRENVTVDHDVSTLGDRARRRGDHSVHGIARPVHDIARRVTEPAATVLDGVTATPCMASRAA